ncbi:MAG TPA: acetylglutamate kinase [Candidatus Alectryocaccobium stercorigallinarum]|jgi:acetylglutamate kinase|nr:acetylglutamate kinase [Candidatus Alectryocaccobium stercorigallinarum]
MKFRNEELTNPLRAEVLIQALPYIKRYVGKTVVIKYGGNAMDSEESKQRMMRDIVLLWLIGVKVVLVHGGGPEITKAMEQFGKEPKFIDGLRVTDKETMDIAQMVLAGKVNKTLVNMLEAQGGKAMGISGMDGRLIEAKVKDERLGYVGEITNINIAPVKDLLEKGYIPVVSTIGCDQESNAYNINGDTAAAYIAGALKAKRLILMTNVNGILERSDDPSSLITDITVSEAGELKAKGIISGGMIPKVDCCIKAIETGTRKVVIINGMIPHAIIMELLTDEGVGTLVKGDKDDKASGNR